MNPNTVTGSRRPWQRRPLLFQDLALLGERLDLTPKATQLLALLGRQALGLARIDLDLARPVAKRLRRDPELASELRNRLATAPEQGHRLTAELQRIRALASDTILP